MHRDSEQVDAAVREIARACAQHAHSVSRTDLQEEVVRLLKERLPDTEIPTIVIEHYVRELIDLIDSQST